MKMVFPLLFFLFILFCASCNSHPAVFESDGFDTAHFRKLNDSLLGKIFHAKFHSNCFMHFIPSSEALNPDNEKSIRGYDFSEVKPKYNSDPHVSTCVYSREADAAQAMKNLKNRTHGESPGLTYTNDYVVRFKNKIYWVNSSCGFAYFNHEKIRDNLLKCIDHKFPADDSIVCRCGCDCD